MTTQVENLLAVNLHFNTKHFALNYAQDLRTTVKESLKRTTSSKWATDSRKVELSRVKYFHAFRCVSLLKSKSGFLIRKRIYRFFTKIEKWIIDPNDPQRGWILWIISKTGYFGYMIRDVSLLRIRKE